MEMKLLKEGKVLGDQIFKIYGSEDEPLFLAKDIAELLGNDRARAMVDKVDIEERIKMPFKMAGSNALSDCWFLTENGLYETLLLSRKLIAKQFKKEVKIILKQIRKHGTFISDNATEEQVLRAEENDILEKVGDSVRVGKSIKRMGKHQSPDELKESLMFIYDKIPATKRAKFLRNVIINVRELKDWYRKSDDVEDFNAVVYERYNIVLLFLIRESEKFTKRSAGHKLGIADKKLNEIVLNQSEKQSEAKLEWIEDFRVSTITYAGKDHKKPCRSARFNLYKVLISAGLYMNDKGAVVYINDGGSYKKYGTLHPDANKLNLCGVQIRYDFDAHEVIIMKQIIK